MWPEDYAIPCLQARWRYGSYVVFFWALLIYDEDLGERGVYGNLEPGSYHYPPDLECLSLLIVEMSFLEFTKKHKKIFTAKWKFPGWSGSLLEMFQKFKNLQPHIHLTLSGKLNATIFFLFKKKVVSLQLHSLKKF